MSRDEVCKEKKNDRDRDENFSAGARTHADTHSTRVVKAKYWKSELGRMPDARRRGVNDNNYCYYCLEIVPARVVVAAPFEPGRRDGPSEVGGRPDDKENHDIHATVRELILDARRKDQTPVYTAVHTFHVICCGPPPQHESRLKPSVVLKM